MALVEFVKVDYPNRTIRLSASELADFRTGPRQLNRRRRGAWRAQLGVKWHREQERASRESGESGQYEVRIEGNWVHRGWIFHIQGRIDQWIEKAGYQLIREIKTTGFPLPADLEDLMENFHPYFVQLGAYLAILGERGSDGSPIKGELLFINIDDDMRQYVADDPAYLEIFQAQVDAICNFLEDQRNRRENVHGLPHVKAFQKLRAGQEGVQEALAEASKKSSVLCFQAPPGFGKTGAVLELSLNQLIRGRCNRVIYLTSKTSGQIQVMKQLKGILGEATELAALQVRNKEELCRFPHCRCQLNDRRLKQGDRWKSCRLSPQIFLEEPTRQPELLLEMGEQESVCPYELMRATLPYADIWVGDLNYLFSPRNRTLFHDQPGFELGESLLIIDEAHNLAGRVADVFSYWVEKGTVEILLAEMLMANSHPAIRSALEDWSDLLAKLVPSDALDDLLVLECRDCSETLERAVRNYPIASDFLDEAALNALWELAETASFFANDHLEKLVWCPQKGRLRLSCLDASLEIGEVIDQTWQTVLMSATLEPRPHYLKQTGLCRRNPAPEWVEAHSPWRREAYRCAVDVRVNTRYKSRGKYLSTTAETLARSVRSSEKPVISFFPSYRYAEDVRRELRGAFPQIRTVLQNRGGAPAEQTAFIDEAMLGKDLLLLILGSGFAEGIDQLGGLVDLAIVVGPALPKVNALQNKRMRDRRDLGRNIAFEEVYQIPGMQKINQALGRLVRAPGQSARILFHGVRFAQPSYQNLLLEDYRSDRLIRNDEELLQWLDLSGALI